MNELGKVVRNSDYSSNHDIDKLARVARTIKPERMSLLQRAGIVSPDQFLKGAHLEAFKSMPSSVALEVEPAVPTKGCFRVDRDDIHQVNLKLLSSGVATLLPEKLALRDSQGKIISGGLFAVDHKAESDRIILDRRPFNELERRLVWARLPQWIFVDPTHSPKRLFYKGKR